MLRRAMHAAGISWSSLAWSLAFSVVFAAAIAATAVSAPGFSLLAALTAWACGTAAAALAIHLFHARLAEIERFVLAATDGERPPDTGVLARLADGRGPVAGVAGALIRHRRESGTRLGEARGEADRLHRIVDGLPGPILLVGPDGRISHVNRAATDAFGDRLVDHDLQTVIRAPDLRDAVAAAFGTGHGHDIEITEAGPIEQVYRVRIVPLAGDACLLAFTVLTDIRRAEQTRVEFVANASHELRTPLAILHGFIETLRGAARDDAEAREQFLEIMNNQSLRMTRLVEDLLSLSRIEAMEHHFPTDEVNLAQLLERTVDAARFVANGKAMTLELDLAAALPPVIGDADNLLQVAQNLIDNAIKYGRENSTVLVSAGMARETPASYPGDGAGAVAVSVRDQGEGIAREHIPRLTERFYRVDNTRSRELGGTGLGLAIVKHIVSRHRGALVITSEIGAGSTVTVYLPASAPAGPAESGAAAADRNTTVTFG